MAEVLIWISKVCITYEGIDYTIWSLRKIYFMFDYFPNNHYRPTYKFPVLQKVWFGKEKHSQFVRLILLKQEWLSILGPNPCCLIRLWATFPNPEPFLYLQLYYSMAQSFLKQKEVSLWSLNVKVKSINNIHCQALINYLCRPQWALLKVNPSLSSSGKWLQIEINLWKETND